MIFKLTDQSQSTTGTRISIRCPHCGHKGTFESIKNDISNQGLVFGLRRCPNNNCFGHLFFVYRNHDGEILMTHPSETIPFDRDNIPQGIIDAFQE